MDPNNTSISVDKLSALIREALRKELAFFNSADIDELLTRSKTAELLGISLPTLDSYTASGKVPAYRIGGDSKLIRYKRSEVLEALEAIN